MTKTEFNYVTYIAAGQQRIWDALLKPEFTRQYWGHDNVSDWKTGSVWEHRDPDGGSPKLVGKVVEFDPPRRLVLTWAHPGDAEQSRVTFLLEPFEDMVRLTVKHDQLTPDSDMLRGITEGWPRVLASLKSLLETGRPLNTWAAKAAR